MEPTACQTGLTLGWSETWINSEANPPMEGMSTTMAVRSTFAPGIPTTFEDLAIPTTLVTDLIVRRLLLEGSSTLQILGSKLRLSIPIIDNVFRQLRQQQIIEVKGMVGNDYSFHLSQAGKQLASDRFQISQYAGACPVPLNDYHAAVKIQRAQVALDRRYWRARLRTW